MGEADSGCQTFLWTLLEFSHFLIFFKREEPRTLNRTMISELNKITFALHITHVGCLDYENAVLGS